MTSEISIRSLSNRLASAAFLLCGSTTVWAQTAPPAASVAGEYSYSIGDDYQNIQRQNFSTAGPNYTFSVDLPNSAGQVSGMASGQNASVRVDATARGTPGGGIHDLGRGADAGAYLKSNYSFVVLGAANQTVNVNVTASGFVSGSETSVGAFFGPAAKLGLRPGPSGGMIDGSSDGLVLLELDMVPGSGNPTSASINRTISVTTNMPIIVQMEVYANASAGYHFSPTFDPIYDTATASAFIDPFFVLTPEYQAQGYTIAVSAGVANSPAIVAVPGPIAGAGLPAALAISGVWFARRRARAHARLMPLPGA